MSRTRKLPRALAALVAVTALGAASIGTAAAGGSDGMSESSGSSGSSESSSTAEQTVVEIAASNPDFSTLVTAVTAAGLVETLSGDGPFTVFAPTDEAFAEIPADDLEALLADEEALAQVLTYHVIRGRILSSDLKKKQKVETVEGSDVVIKVNKKKGPRIEGVSIVATDIEGSNGVVHVIDEVLLPPDLS